MPNITKSLRIIGFFSLSLFPAWVSLSHGNVDGNTVSGNASEDAALQLSGTTSFNGQWEFNIKDLRNETSFWLGLGQTLHGVQAVAYDEGTKQLTVAIGGKRTTIRMRSADGIPLEVSQSRNIDGYREVEVPELPLVAAPPDPPNMGAPPAIPAPDKTPEIPVSLMNR